MGPDWYRAQFEGWSGEPVVGEATPGYMIWRHRPAVVAPRIHEIVPDVRLIAILRNPVDRAHSAMLHHIAHEKLPKDVDLLELVRSTPPERDPLGIVSGGWYAESLEPFLDVFGDQLLIVLHDDISADARSLYTQALRHVGASADAIRRRPGRGPLRISAAARCRHIVGRKALPLDERRALYEYFAADIAKLEKMLDRDLTRWSPE